MGRRHLLPLVSCLAAVLLALAPAAAWAQNRPARGWLVVPFEIAGPSSRTYWLGEGAAVIVADALGRAGVPVLPREARADTLDDLRLPSTVTLTRATNIRVAELVGAPVAVFGEVTIDEHALTLSAHRLDLETGQLGAEVTEQGNLIDLFAVGARLAARLAGRDGAPRGEAPAASLESFEAYVKALLTDRPDARIRLLDQALIKAPDYHPIRLALWTAHTELGDHAKALTAVEPVPDAASVGRQARFFATLSLIELKRHDEAFTTLRALADERADAALFNNLGVVQLRRGATPQTGLPTYYLTKAAELEPGDGDVCFNLGYAYWQERDARGAIYWLREALRRNPADADAHFVLAAALDAAGTSLEAGRERTLARLLSSRYAEAPKSAGPGGVPRGLERVTDSMSAWHAMRFDTALAAADQRNQAELVAFHLDRARRFIDQHRDGDAEPELRRVLFLAPYHAEAHLLAGRLYMRSGRRGEAVAAYRISLWSEETPDAHVALAEALIDARDTPGARAALDRALTLDPDHAGAAALLARIAHGRRATQSEALKPAPRAVNLLADVAGPL